MRINDLSEQAKQLQLSSITISKSLQYGMFRSLFLGQGIEFDSCREYELSDDVRNIDWNLTARTGKAYVKLFREEHDVNIFIVVDGSSSMLSKIQNGMSYSEKAFEIASLFLFAGVHLACPVGSLVFSDEVKKIFTPKLGKDFAYSIVYELKNLNKKTSGKSNMDNALGVLNRALNKKSLVIIVSDFKISSYKKSLSLLAKHHDVIAIKVISKYDHTLPSIGSIPIYDDENKILSIINTYSITQQESYKNAFLNQLNTWENTCIDCGVLPCKIELESNTVSEISEFLLSAKTKHEFMNAIKAKR